MVNGQEADFVSLGRGALANPDWPHKVEAEQDLRKFEMDLISPVATLNNQAGWEAEQADVAEPLTRSGSAA